MLDTLIAAVRDGHWYWGLGDPEGAAIAVTLLYFLVSLMCLQASRTANVQESQVAAGRNDAPVSEPQFWISAMVVFLLLGINKQADLQSLLTLYGRDIAKTIGLYEYSALAASYIHFGSRNSSYRSHIIYSLRAAMNLSWACKLAFVGLAMQAAFVVIRASSFHHVDELLGVRLADSKLNLWIESVGIFITLTAAWLRLRPTSRHAIVV